MTKKKEEITIEEKIEAEQTPESTVSDEFETKYLRALADYQNLEKRIERDKELLVKLARLVLGLPTKATPNPKRKILLNVILNLFQDLPQLVSRKILN